MAVVLAGFAVIPVAWSRSDIGVRFVFRLHQRLFLDFFRRQQNRRKIN
jgi:hypothetical protein